VSVLIVKLGGGTETSRGGRSQGTSRVVNGRWLGSAARMVVGTGRLEPASIEGGKFWVRWVLDSDGGGCVISLESENRNIEGTEWEGWREKERQSYKIRLGSYLGLAEAPL
jgi:hypothetical protein